MNTHFIFVYGTLRRGGIRAMPLLFPRAKFVGTAKVRGSLFDFGEYPGLILDESGSTVTGEVYEIDEETLNSLDEIEAPAHYLRKQVEIDVDNHKVCSWLYEPDPEFYSLSILISSGDWVEHARMKTDPAD